MLLQKATNQMAYGKVGIFGFQGSGKSYTATLIAIGINDLVKDKRPIGWFDTETGSDFLIPKVKEAGYELLVVKSRAFTDLVQVIDEAEKECAVLIIDSITHVWRELCETYKRKFNRTRLQFQDWDAVKKEWGVYTDKFVNSKLHIVVCGRAGYDYDYDFNEDGTKDLIKTGTKMKAEGEFGFEPSLVVEMERVTPGQEALEELRDIKNDKEKRQRKQTFAPKVGSKWIHRAHVLKDRTDTINGQSYDYPTFVSFLPHFQSLNIGGSHFGVDTQRNSGDLFHPETGGSVKQRETRKQIALETIEGALTKLWPGSTTSEKKLKKYMVELVFGTLSWKAVENRSLEELESRAKELLDFSERFPIYADGNEDLEAAAKEVWSDVAGEELTRPKDEPEPVS